MPPLGLCRVLARQSRFIGIWPVVMRHSLGILTGTLGE
jgi:hypothetical protein